MKKILGIAMVLGVFGVILGGCGKSDDAAAGGTTAGATAGATAGDAAK